MICIKVLSKANESDENEMKMKMKWEIKESLK